MQPTPPTSPVAISETVNAVETTEIIETTLDTSPKTYYQAIGWLRGKLVKEEDRFLVEIKDKTFPLYLPRKVFAVANNSLEQMVWLKCYPQSKGEGLSFKVIWMGPEQSEKGEAGIFVLRGVWQFIPQSRRPVFSIYRNELKVYESRPNNQHLPLIWADQPPYRFRKDSEERPKFYQITARLIPQRGCFGFVSQIADPIEQTPRRVKKPPLNATPGNEKEGAKGDRKEPKSEKESKASAHPKPTKEPKISPQETVPTPEEIKVVEPETAIAETTVTGKDVQETTNSEQQEQVTPSVSESVVETAETPKAAVQTEMVLEPVNSVAETPEAIPAEVPVKAKKSTTTKKAAKTTDVKEKVVPTATEVASEPELVLEPVNPVEETPEAVPVKAKKSTTTKKAAKTTEITTEGEVAPKAKRKTKTTKSD